MADFVDADIDEKLRALERDEDAAAAEHERLVRVLSGFCTHQYITKSQPVEESRKALRQTGASAQSV